MRSPAPYGWSAALLCLLLAGCDALPGRPTEAERPLRPEQVVDVGQLYDVNCAGCHGADGRLGAARPLNDPLYLAVIGLDRLRQVTADGVPDSAMPGFAPAAGGTLTDAQVDILARGIMTRWGTSPPAGVALPPYAAPPGDPQRGAAAFTTYCAGCHGSDGRGGKKGGSVVNGSFLGLVSDQALRTAVICGRPDLGMPDWRANVEGRPMAMQAIADVVAWLIAQRPKYPGQPYGRPADRAVTTGAAGGAARVGEEAHDG